MVRDVVQNNLSLIDELRDSLNLEEYRKAKTKQKMLRWAQSIDFPEKFSVFYGKSAPNELKSVTLGHLGFISGHRGGI